MKTYISSIFPPAQIDQVNKTYKILVISDYRSVASARPEAEIFIRLAQQGHKICILTHPSAAYYIGRFRSFGIEVIEQPPSGKVSISYIRFLRQLILDKQFDFVHAFNSKGLTNAVWAMRGLPAKLIAYRGYAGQTHWYDPMMYLKYFHPRVDHIICVSKDIEHILSRNIAGGKSKLTTIPKGHDPAWYKDIVPVDRSSIGCTDDEILVCFLANVRPFKGLPYLLKATYLLDQAMPVKFIFIGQGYDDPKIQKEMSSSPMHSHFKVLGFRNDALQVLAACDGLVQASTHGEGLSKSIVEAMCLGIAPIVTDIAGNKGLVENGKSGWVVPIKNPKAIAEAIQEMASSKTEREERGLRAREHMRLHLHIDQTVEEYENLYKNILLKNQM